MPPPASGTLAPRSLLPLHSFPHLPLRHLLCLFLADPSLAPPYLFDLAITSWSPLSPLPCSPHLYGLSDFILVALGPHLYILGGSHFDARSYPIGHPTASATGYRLNLATLPLLAWHRLPDMLSPRDCFACAPILCGDGGIIVAGDGSRHPMFPSKGSRMSSVERFDVDSNEWRMREWGVERTVAGWERA